MSSAAPANGEALAPESGPSVINPSHVEEVATFIDGVCKADELDERLDIAGAAGATRHVVDSLNAFLDKLWAKDFQLSAKQEMLEKVVEIRTNEVHEILDNVSTGFFLTLQDETVLDNFSRSCRDIFGVDDLKGHKLSELMHLGDAAKFEFSLFYSQVFEEVLPPQVALGQLRTEFGIGDRTYSIQGAPVFARDGKVAKLFFTVNDTTELRKVEAENALRQSLLEIVRQKDNFRIFLHETSQAFQAARASGSQVGFRTLLHTTKGNLGCYGLAEIAALIHSIEDAPEITAKHLQQVEDTLKRFMLAHCDILGLEYPDAKLAGDSGESERLRPILEAIAREPSAAAREAAVADFLRKVSWVSAGALLSPLRGVVDRVARRLEKLVDIEIVGSDVRVDAERVGHVFASFVHVIRNSLDHGIEEPDDRAPKSPCGHIRVACREEPDAWVVEIADDGRGIDPDAVAEAAVAKGGVPRERVDAMSPEEKLRLIFLQSVTTKDQATEDSGRGVGMTAILESVEALRGTVAVTSKKGEGTRFVVRIPYA